MTKKLLTQALEFLEDSQHLVADNERHAYVMEYNSFIEQLKEALAKQEQGEPVVYIPADALRQIMPPLLILRGVSLYGYRGDGLTPLYTTPQQRTWVGLTPEEVKEVSLANRPYVVDMVVALEARLKQKNGYDT
jgi:hypothetical protein